MNSQELYKELEKRNKTLDNYLVTIVDGKQRGNKAFISGKEVIALESSAIFEKNLDEIFGAKKQECTIDGNRLFIEKVGNKKKIVICGGGHVSNAIVKLARTLGFHITVIDDRPKFAEAALSLGADNALCDEFEKVLDNIDGDNDTYFIIVTRGHRHDRNCLLKILKKKYAYLGMMGSKGRIKNLKASLIEDKEATMEELETLSSPIGIDINAETPSEIAVSIMGEIISIKNKSARYDGYTSEMIDALTGKDEYGGRQVLATIVTRKGSAPRAKGTKMIIRDNSTIIGTIGGGCMESEVIRKAQYMMASYNEDTKPELVFVDISGKYAEDEGMACGGVIEVFLEMI